MMASRTLARYIAVRFLTTITGAFLLCTSLIFLVDFIELLRQSGKFGGASMGTLIWLGLLRLPAYAELTLPFAVLVGTIAAFLTLSRSSELIIIRASGMSVWQFMMPGLLIALLFGVLAVTVYNPLAANARAHAEQIRAEAFNRTQSLLKTKAGSWLRQDGIDGPSIINAKSVANQGLTLAGVTIIQFDRNHKFVERVAATKAVLRNRHWLLSDAWVSRPSNARESYQAEFYKTYAVATHLTPAQVSNALGSVISISFWELPDHIEFSERAGLPSTRYKVQYELLLARPFLLAVMVLLGATVSLRAFRFGRIQIMVVIGLVAGFGFFILLEMSRQIGLSGLTPPHIAAWVPVAIACFLSLTALLHQEDG